MTRPGTVPTAVQLRVSLGLRLLLLALVLFAFFVSIELLAASIRLFGSGLAQSLFNLTSNPLVALFIGICATSLMQSSSATTSMVVAMVASGSLEFTLAVPIMMGANIGTSVTNTLVSIGHIRSRIEFRRAFGASTVHDMFNLLAVLMFFPIEVLTGWLDRAGLAVAVFFENLQGFAAISPIQKTIKPVVEQILELLRLTLDSKAGWNPVAWFGLGLAVLLLFGSISQLTRVLKLLFMGKAEGWFQTRLFDQPFKAMLLGLVLTALVQSSSITTSLIVPLAGAGLLNLQQVFPYTLGANVGTTVTALLASLATANPFALAIAIVHLIFNLAGTLLIWPIRALPIWLADQLARAAARRRWIPLVYVLVLFFLMPLGVILLTQ
jgi:solute carrier family 34 (sodium-dependent phosphate cotransporter)